MTVHYHSRLAFMVVNKDINVKQAQVLNTFHMFGEMTDEEVAEKLGWPINRISGRVGELIKLGRLEPFTDRIQNGRKVRVCRIINN